MSDIKPYQNTNYQFITQSVFIYAFKKHFTLLIWPLKRTLK
jgi:hypothetical protein